MKRMKINRILLVGTAMLIIGLALGWVLKPSGHQHRNTAAEMPADSDTTRIYTCSMHPQVRQPKPGKCPICGMDLAPLDNGSSDGQSMAIKMSATAMQLANVQTAVVGYGKPLKEIRLVGKIQVDERRIFSQTSHIPGRIERLFVNFTGEPVQKGQQLATLYSPELVTAQEELLSALKIKDSQPALFAAAKEKLKNWKLTDQQIQQIITTGKPTEQFPILADVSGLVMKKQVNPGDYIMRGSVIYEIVDLSRVWVLFDVYENDMAWVKVGSPVSFSVQSFPGETFAGRITFIDPIINPTTRVAAARVEMSNPGRKLKPQMFVTGYLKSKLSGGGQNILVPKSAVMWTGERSVVYIKKMTAQGIAFTMQEVVLGAQVGENYIVKEGLQPGTEIAVNGTFSIDAAAQLAGKPSMMNQRPAKKTETAPPSVFKDEKKAVPALPSQGGKGLYQIFDQYFTLEDALVQSNFNAAQKAAGTLKESFETTPMHSFSGQERVDWMRLSPKAIGALQAMEKANSLVQSRDAFKLLSTQIIALARTLGPQGQTFYIQHCPMADDNKGADWLSRGKEVLNPYFGDAMLTCGSVTETLYK